MEWSRSTELCRATAQRQQAETDAANVSGISGIMNNINVTNPDAAGTSAGLTAQSSANQFSPQDQTADQNQDQGQYRTSLRVKARSRLRRRMKNQSQPAPYQQGYPQQQGYPPQQRDTHRNSRDTRRSSRAIPSSPIRRRVTPSSRVIRPSRDIRSRATLRRRSRCPTMPHPPARLRCMPEPFCRVRLSEPLDTKRVKDGTTFQATAAVNVYENGVLAIPRGAVLNGQVVQSKEGGPSAARLYSACNSRVSISVADLSDSHRRMVQQRPQQSRIYCREYCRGSRRRRTHRRHDWPWSRRSRRRRSRSRRRTGSFLRNQRPAHLSAG